VTIFSEAPAKPANDWLMSLRIVASLRLERMSLAEILEELPKLTEEERDELRSRLDEYPVLRAPALRRESHKPSGGRRPSHRLSHGIRPK
jgi:hypothetical protein